MGGSVVVAQYKIMHLYLMIHTTLSFAKNRKPYVPSPGSIPGLPTNCKVHKFVLKNYLLNELTSYCEVTYD